MMVMYAMDKIRTHHAVAYRDEFGSGVVQGICGCRFVPTNGFSSKRPRDEVYCKGCVGVELKRQAKTPKE